jgi:predicted Zn-ribbon and HTH transcriptional regulator
MTAPAQGAIRSLPILTLDEVEVAASFGYLFDARQVGPCESIVSMLWKFARMNGLAGSRVVSQLSAAPLDPYEGLPASHSGVDVRRVARLLGLTQKAVRSSLGSASGRRLLSPRLRHCPRCMACGYHGVAHQFLGAMQCPAHGDWLEEGCRACGHVSDYRLDAQLLDAPFRCARCRRPYARGAMRFEPPRQLPQRIRVAMTRAYLA